MPDATALPRPCRPPSSTARPHRRARRQRQGDIRKWALRVAADHAVIAVMDVHFAGMTRVRGLARTANRVRAKGVSHDAALAGIAPGVRGAA